MLRRTMETDQGIGLACNPRDQEAASFQEPGPLGSKQFRGGTRGGSPEISDEIRDREVNLMAHGTHHRHAGFGNGAGDDLFIELPEILQTPSPATND